jgi:signal transduction histidine kinase
VSATTAPTVADLRPVDLFDDIDDAALAPWAAAAELREVEPGCVIVRQEDRGTGLQLLLTGTVHSQMVVGGHVELLRRNVAPTWIGAVASLTGAPLGVSMVTETPCRLAVIGVEAFERLVLGTPAVHRRIMRQVAPVVGGLVGMEQNRERLAALGTMAAGLAHELNNPAAAAKRTADELAGALDVISSTLGHFVEAGVEREQALVIVRLHREIEERATTRTTLDALDAADAEDALIDRLEALGVAEPWRVAEPLAAAGVDDEWLDRMAAAAGSAAGGAIAYVAATLAARGLAGELRESTERMSALVGAVKAYAYMDRGGTVEVDVHDGLETTLVVLGHKLKQTEIEVVRDYDRTLPRIMVHGSELNQVWTNLLDNAIDALDGRGTITLRTAREGSCLLVEVADDGPGIAPELRDRVFDPFFTTKDVGLGTGLGLDAVRRILVDRHEGSISVDSEPGSTTFHVRLPLDSP